MGYGRYFERHDDHQYANRHIERRDDHHYDSKKNFERRDDDQFAKNRNFERRDDHQYDKNRNFERRDDHQYDNYKNFEGRDGDQCAKNRNFERRDDHQYDNNKNFERHGDYQYDRKRNSTVTLRSAAGFRVSRDGGRYGTQGPSPGASAYSRDVGRDAGRDTGRDSGGRGRDTGGWGRGAESRGGINGSGGAGAGAMGVWAAPAPPPAPVSDLLPTPTPRPFAAPMLSSPGPIISGGLHKDNNQSFSGGDWICTSCGDHQFAKNKICRSCGAPRPAVFESDRGILPTVKNDWPNREDDWMNPARTSRAAQASFPPEPPRFPPEPPRFPPGPPLSLNLSPCTAGRSHRPVEAPAAPAPRSTQPKLEGDWYCPACGDHQFAKNVICRSCGFPKPVLPGMGGGWATYGHYGPAPAAASRGSGGPYNTDPVPAFNPKDGFRMGDWGCPNCGDHQFAKNTHCRKCGTPRPASLGTMLKPGDWICPNPQCGDVQFAKNDICRKCGVERPPETF